MTTRNTYTLSRYKRFKDTRKSRQVARTTYKDKDALGQTGAETGLKYFEITLIRDLTNIYVDGILIITILLRI